MWVNAESCRGDQEEFKLNLEHAIAIEEYSLWFDVIFLRKNYLVKKTPEMVKAYSSLAQEPEITPEEVAAPEAKPVEEWVTQDKVRVRCGIDQYRYVKKDGSVEGGWRYAQAHDNWDAVCLHGWVDSDGTTLELRCHKLHLPQGFFITGRGKYLTRDGAHLHITGVDTTEPRWFSSKGWYDSNGRPTSGAPDKTIVALIELEEEDNT